MEENCLYRKLCFHFKASGSKDSSIMKKKKIGKKLGNYSMQLVQVFLDWKIILCVHKWSEVEKRLFWKSINSIMSLLFIDFRATRNNGLPIRYQSTDFRLTTSQLYSRRLGNYLPIDIIRYSSRAIVLNASIQQNHLIHLLNALLSL